MKGLPRWLSGKESTCHAGDAGSVPESGRSPGEGNAAAEQQVGGAAIDRSPRGGAALGALPGDGVVPLTRAACARSQTLAGGLLYSWRYARPEIRRQKQKHEVLTQKEEAEGLYAKEGWLWSKAPDTHRVWPL